MDIVILCILMFTLVVASIILAIALAVVTKRYVNLEIEYKKISRINIDNDFVTIYGKCEGGSGGSGTDEPSPVILTYPNQNIESEREIDSFDAIVDEEKYKYDICLDLRNHGKSFHADSMTHNDLSDDILNYMNFFRKIR